ncbi:AraC family transcriptional regulator, partial [Candidatus Thiothrix sp. Deng01]
MDIMVTPYEQDNIIAFVAHRVCVEIHKHHCFQVLLSLTEPFTSTIQGVAHNSRGLIINQSVAYSCHAAESNTLVYFIDPESRIGGYLKQVLDGQVFARIDHLWKPECCSGWSAVTAGNHAGEFPQLPAGLAREALRQVLADDLFQRVVSRDERIVRAIAWIEASLQQRISLQDVADYICLSPEYARHLFTQETGVSFSQFLLWKRIKHAIALTVGDGQSLTNAALASGFTDQAHFCRLFKRTFGIPARGLLKKAHYGFQGLGKKSAEDND